uniref:Acyl-CoA dehydrogenase n=1 Tax=Heterorhabditis bacteriophora TaxID=37862 RepID=A0A1I7XIN7_HETBA
MRKAACNRSRLSNVMDTDIYMQTVGQAMTSPHALREFSPQEKKDDNYGMEQFELYDIGPPRAAGMVEEGWTFQV